MNENKNINVNINKNENKSTDNGSGKKYEEFWDLRSLMPKKRPPVMRQNKPDVSAVTLEFEPPATSDVQSGVRSLSHRFHEVGKTELPPSQTEAETERNNEHAGERDNAPVLRQTVTRRPVYGAATKGIGSQLRVELRADEVACDGKSNSAGGDMFTIPQKRERVSPEAEKIDEYEPQGGLIRRVKIMKWPTKYSFYEQFRFDAKRYSGIHGVQCEEVPFFSYTPQYRQMTSNQLSYYFYWRERAREGKWLSADFSYILLYIYEIINLYEIIPPQRGIELLCGVWLDYRDKYATLDKYLSEWVADYCMIHKLPPPLETLAPIMPHIMENASFREFYMPQKADDAETMINLSSNYFWQKSKYVSQNETAEDAERIKLFRRHITGALDYVIKNTDDGRFGSEGMRAAVMSRDAFCGSLCAQNVKRRIDIEYYSYSRSHEQRAYITEIVKYAENKLRAHIGIKSRLRINELDDKTKATIDAYFMSVFPDDRRRQSRSDEEAVQERYYEAMYGPLTVGTDANRAREIEQSSWLVTERLTDITNTADGEADDENHGLAVDANARTGCDEAVRPDGAVADICTANEAGGVNDEINGGTDSGTDTASSLYDALDDICRRFIITALDGDAEAQAALCREESLYPDVIAAKINEIACDYIGDIVLESRYSPDFYGVIEDYREEIKA